MSAMIQGLASSYFDLLAEHFPVMTGSDEFHFFPRLSSERAEAEDFDPDRIERLLIEVKSIRAGLEEAGCESTEEEVDRRLLTLSVNNFIFHFQDMPLYKRDPTLYLKVLVMGLDRSRFPEGLNKGREREWVGKRLDSIAKMILCASSNLTLVPDIQRDTGVEMIRDVKVFLKELRKGEFFKSPSFDRRFSRIEDSLMKLRDHLSGLSCSGRACVGEEFLGRILTENLGWPFSLDDARERIHEDISDSEAALSRISKKTGKGKNPDDLISSLPVPALDSRGILAAYRREVGSIREFIIETGLFPLDDDPGVKVEFTPPAMRSVRSAASYAAPSGTGSNPGRYYILPVPRRPHTSEQKKRLEFIHRQMRFVTAHETFPGHHLIDLARLRNPDPVRRSIELPLVYEGWACYAESILARAGYFSDPAEGLLLHKRRWWRAMRGLCDLSFQSGVEDIEGASRYLLHMGLSRESAVSTARRFALNPGYQVCYTLGTSGFYGLYRDFSGRLEERELHRLILEAGEAPMDEMRALLEKRLKEETGAEGGVS